jgi:hypothetical protein
VAAQKDQIQSLIADIDGLLNKANPRLPWVMASDTAHQRQVLERVRNFLVSLQRKVAIDNSLTQPRVRRDLMAHDIYYQQPSATQDEPSTTGVAQPDAQQLLQSVVEEMSYLRANLMQPLQDDLEALRQQRESLTQEIRQLETQRQGYSLLQQQNNQQHLSHELLQAYMGRLQDNLAQQINQAIASAQRPAAGSNALITDGRSSVALPGGANLPSLPNPAQHLEQVQQLQAQSDQMLMNLDVTLRTVFETLQRNVQGYQESLSQGVDRMHNLGQQGEMMFTALVNHLAQQLGREASSYLQTSAQLTELQPSAGQSVEGNRLKPSIEPASTNPPSLISTTGTSPSLANLNLPFPGTELPRTAPTAYPAPNPTFNAQPSPAPATSLESPDLSLEALDIDELNLGDLDLDAADSQAIDDLLNADTFATDAGVIDELSSSGLAPSASAPQPATPSIQESTSDTTDLDAALKLLEQLSSEIRNETTSVESAEAEIDRALSASTDSETGAAPVEPETQESDAELEALYESLFGIETTDVGSVDLPETEESALESIASTDAEIESPLSIDPFGETEPSIFELPAETNAGDGDAALQGIEDWQDQRSINSDVEIADSETPHASIEDELSPVYQISSLEESQDLGFADFAPSEIAEVALEPNLDLSLDSDDDAQYADFGSEPVDAMGGWDAFVLSSTEAQIAPEEAVDLTFSEPTDLAAFSQSEDDLEITLDLSQSAPEEIDEISSLTDLIEQPIEAPSAEEIDLTTALSDISLSSGLESSPVQNPEAIAGGAISTPQPPAPKPAQRTEASQRTETSPNSGTSEESYIAAAPEENLLPTDLTIEPEPNLWLDENTISQLSQDLSRLEEIEGFELALQTEDDTTSLPDTDLPDTADLSFADWGAEEQSQTEDDATSLPDTADLSFVDWGAEEQEQDEENNPSSPDTADLSFVDWGTNEQSQSEDDSTNSPNIADLNFADWGADEQSQSDEAPSSSPDTADLSFADWGADAEDQNADSNSSPDIPNLNFANWGAEEQNQGDEELLIPDLDELDDETLAELAASLPETIAPAPSTAATPTEAESSLESSLNLDELQDDRQFPLEPVMPTSTFEQRETVGSEPSPDLTLAAMNDLFADLLTEESNVFSSPPVESTLEEFENFTIDDFDQLPEDLPEPSAAAAASPTPTPIPPEVTLEGMEDLFADLPTPEASESSETPNPTRSQLSETSTQNVTLDNAFGGAIKESTSSPNPAQPQSETDSEKKN